MSEEIPGAAASTRSFAQAVQVDVLCDRFEADWRAGRRPAIAEFLTAVPVAARADLLAELLAIEVGWRRRYGEQPTPHEYAAQFPQDTELVASAFDQSGATVAQRDWDPDQPPHDPGADAPEGSSRVGLHYQILRRHARGGLGEVFIAHDETLNREVALKEIRADHAGDSRCQSRFLREAEITGGLEHPGIIPIYGLGRHGDGRPFYVMPLIRGRSLHEAIEAFHPAEGADHHAGARAVEFRKLLARFLEVCNAVDYAHSQGVLHRDLKPANIMLGPFGETLVVDWGLAKVLGPSDQAERANQDGEEPVAEPARSGSPTLPGSALGTPQYMSPEQAAGDLDHLDARSDVYSLGATLYCLLTGRAPFEGRDAQAVLPRVRAGDFAAPRARDRKIPRPLEAICLKAMALRPVDRYPSARAMADDIERWLADEPVSAYREPPSHRLARWARHHRPLVAGAVALLATAVVALAVSTVLIGRERLREADQRRRAEVNFARARQAVDQMLSAVGEVELADVPQMGAARRRLLEKALRFYQDFLAERHDDAALAVEVGRAHARLAAVQDLLGQLGAAERSYRQAIAICEQLAARTPRADVDADRARSSEGLGVLLKKAHRLQEAEAMLRNAVAVHQRLAVAQPDRLDYQQALAASRYHLGTVLARRPGRGSQDEEAYRQAVTIQANLVAATRGRPDARRNQARYLNNLGLLLADAGRLDEAESHYRQAETIQQALIAQDAQAPGNRWQLARTQANLAVLLQAKGQLADAEARFHHARDLQRRLAAEFPDIPDYRLELGAILDNLGLLWAATARPQLAEQVDRESLALRERLVAEFPDVPDYRQKMAVTKLNLALVLEQTDPEAARRVYREALELQEAITDRFPEVFEYRLALGRTLYTFAGLHVRHGELAEARHLLEQAIDHHQSALEINDRSRSCREYLRDDHGVLAVVLLRLRDHRQAARAAAELPRILPEAAFEHLRAAGFLAQCAALARHDETLADPQRQACEEDYGRRAVELLQHAFDSGLLRDPAVLEQPDFRPLRGRDDFQRLKAGRLRMTGTGVG